MASSSSSGGEGEVLFGVSSPTTTDHNDNDSFFVTDNGLASGVPIEFWKFDSDIASWIEVPLGSECPAPMTRTALLTLRNSGSLDINCHYVIIDYNRGTVGAAIILLHAVEPNTLSMSVKVKTTYDNLAWEGTYDIDLNLIESLHDNIGNDVYGQISVDTFPWGNASVAENEVREGRLNYNGGVFRENFIGGGTTVTTSGTVDQNRFAQNALVNISGGIFSQNTVENDANVTIVSGTNIHNSFESSTTYRQVGTGFVRYSELGGNSTVINGNTNITDSRMYDTDFNTTGSTGSITANSFHNTSLTNLQNIPNLVVQGCSFQSRSQVSANGAARLRLYRCNGDGGGRFLVSASREMNCSYCDVKSYGYIQTTNGIFTINYSSATNLGYISHQSTGTNTVDRSHASTQGNIRFLNSVTGGRIYYSETSSGGTIYQSGTSTNCYHYYCNAASLGQMYVENSVDARHYYCSASDYGYVRAYGNNTGQSIMYYSKAFARGFIEHLNITARQRFYSINASSQGIIRQTGGAAGNTYYSGVTAYYYLFLTTSGVTRFGLFGRGRQTFNGTPTTNGIGERNWT